MRRYRQGDVIEIPGSDSIDDGNPILRYIERPQVRIFILTFIPVPGALISEKELASTIFSAQDVPGSIIEFTVIVDDRKVPSSLAFLIEIDGALCMTVSSSQKRPALICFADGNSHLG